MHQFIIDDKVEIDSKLALAVVSFTAGFYIIASIAAIDIAGTKTFSNRCDPVKNTLLRS